jgi:hypothetical protein
LLILTVNFAILEQFEQQNFPSRAEAKTAFAEMTKKIIALPNKDNLFRQIFSVFQTASFLICTLCLKRYILFGITIAHSTVSIMLFQLYVLFCNKV